MPQNIYDDPEFFAGYKNLRDTKTGLNDDLEQPALRALLPPLAGLDILELGCGMGQFARWCSEQGAANIVAVDVSEKMLEVARRENALSNVQYVLAALEDLTNERESFDLIVSSLAMHYLENYGAMVRHVYDWLRPGGLFVFSTEHPVYTARRDGAVWAKDEAGRSLYWTLDNYSDEGERRQTWFVSGVLKYHRKLSTLTNGLIEAGLIVERVEEPEATPDALARRPLLVNESRRPPFVLFRARKP